MNLIKKILSNIINSNIYTKSVYFYIKKNECMKFSDCLILAKKLKNPLEISEREIEYPWIINNINVNSSNKLLDIGCGNGSKITEYFSKKCIVYGLEKNANQSKQTYFTLVKGDIRKTLFKDNFFNIVCCVSTLEHIGVMGRYNVKKEDNKGDLKAMKEIFRILKNGGLAFVTVPYGKHDLLPLNRIYNKQRIKRIFSDFKIIKTEYYKYSEKLGFWLRVSEKVAAEVNWQKDPWYALGLFILEK